MKCARWLLFGPMVLLLGACGTSPRTQFFTLVAIPPQSGPVVGAAGPVQIVAVHVPAILDRPQRVVENSKARLDVLEQEEWGAPLNDMIRRVLSQDLAARLPPGRVLTPDTPSAPGTRGIVIDVQEFQPDPGGRVLLDVGWTVLPGGSFKHALRVARRFTLQAGSGADSQVQAMSALLARLADAIVASLDSGTHEN